MSIKENLQKAISNGEELAKACLTYARQAGSNPASLLFQRMANNILSSVGELRKELRRYCGT